MSSSLSGDSNSLQWREDLHFEQEYSFVSSLGDPLEVMALEADKDQNANTSREGEEFQQTVQQPFSSGEVSSSVPPPVAILPV